MRYELCEKCLFEYTKNGEMRDEFLSSIVKCSLTRIGLILHKKEAVKWKNCTVEVSREAGWKKGFAHDKDVLCRDCRYKMEHTIFGGK